MGLLVGVLLTGHPCCGFGYVGHSSGFCYQITLAAGWDYELLLVSGYLTFNLLTYNF